MLRSGKQKSIRLAYLAGLIDGEGSIRIEKKNPKRKNGERYIVYEANVSIHNNNPLMMNWIEKHFSRSYTVRGGRRGNRQPSYKTMWRSRTASKVLKTVLPYLVLKRMQAKLVLTLQKRLKRRGRQRLTEKELATRERLFLDCKELNSRFRTPSG